MFKVQAWKRLRANSSFFIVALLHVVQVSSFAATPNDPCGVISKFRLLSEGDSGHPHSAIPEERRSTVVSLHRYLGIQSLMADPELAREIEVLPDGLRFFGDPGIDRWTVELRWSEDASVTKPEIEENKETKTVLLRLPPEFRVPEPSEIQALESQLGNSLSPGEKASVTKKLAALIDKQEDFHRKLRRAFVGHSFHPYTNTDSMAHAKAKLGVPSFRTKPAQEQAVATYHKTIDAGRRRFLAVGPTGFGKTFILREILKHRLGLDSAKSGKLHVLIADQGHLVKDLHDIVDGLQGEVGDFNLVKWGDGEKATSVEELMESVNASEKPTVLVTTVQSLRKRIGMEGDDDEIVTQNIEKFARETSSILYDEAHHTGAANATRFISDVMDFKDEASGMESRAFLAGVTATPVRGDKINVIEDFFRNRAFYAYLDDVDSFEAEHATIARPFQDLVKQLVTAIQEGELTPFRTVTFSPSMLESSTKGNFYIASDGAEQAKQGTRYVVNPDLHDDLIRLARPIYESNAQTLIIANSIAEADSYAASLRRNFPGKRVEVLHSQVKSSEKKRGRPKGSEEKEKTERERILADLRDGKIDMIVSVRQLDEGVDVPHLSALHVLSKEPSIGKLLQRVGRVIRLSQNKRVSDVILPFELTPESAKEQLQLFEGIQQLERETGADLFAPLDNLGHSGSSPKTSSARVAEAGTKAEPDFHRDLDEALLQIRHFVDGSEAVSTKSLAEKLDRMMAELEREGKKFEGWKTLRAWGLEPNFRYHNARNRAVLFDSLDNQTIAKFVLDQIDKQSNSEKGAYQLMEIVEKEGVKSWKDLHAAYPELTKLINQVKKNEAFFEIFRNLDTPARKLLEDEFGVLEENGFRWEQLPAGRKAVQRAFDRLEALVDGKEVETWEHLLVFYPEVATAVRNHRNKPEFYSQVSGSSAQSLLEGNFGRLGEDGFAFSKLRVRGGNEAEKASIEKSRIEDNARGFLNWLRDKAEAGEDPVLASSGTLGALEKKILLPSGRRIPEGTLKINISRYSETPEFLSIVESDPLYIDYRNRYPIKRRKRSKDAAPAEASAD